MSQTPTRQRIDPSGVIANRTEQTNPAAALHSGTGTAAASSAGAAGAQGSARMYCVKANNGTQRCWEPVQMDQFIFRLSHNESTWRWCEMGDQVCEHEWGTWSDAALGADARTHKAWRLSRMSSAHKMRVSQSTFFINTRPLAGLSRGSVLCKTRVRSPRFLMQGLGSPTYDASLLWPCVVSLIQDDPDDAMCCMPSFVHLHASKLAANYAVGGDSHLAAALRARGRTFDVKCSHQVMIRAACKTLCCRTLARAYDAITEAQLGEGANVTRQRQSDTLLLQRDRQLWYAGRNGSKPPKKRFLGLPKEDPFLGSHSSPMAPSCILRATDGSLLSAARRALLANTLQEDIGRIGRLQLAYDFSVAVTVFDRSTGDAGHGREADQLNLFDDRHCVLRTCQANLQAGTLQADTLICFDLFDYLFHGSSSSRDSQSLAVHAKVAGPPAMTAAGRMVDTHGRALVQALNGLLYHL